MTWVLILALGLLASQPARAADAPANEPTDWPSLISRLQQQLERLPGHAATRKQLATAHNNYGVSLANQQQLELAAGELEEAIRLDPSDPQFRRNLAAIILQKAQGVYEARKMKDAKELLEQVVTLNPDDASAYILLGEIEYNSQRLKEARAAWERALALNPELPELRTKLDQLNQELPVESQFEKLTQIYFDIRYAEEIPRAQSVDIRDQLLTARRDVGSDFQHWPKHRLVVLVYSAAQFRAVRQQMPDWVAGQYDGKIRVPLPGDGLDSEAVKRILTHEYTHAVVHDLTQHHCPVWLNEGLAEYQAWKRQIPPWPMLRQALANHTVIPWADLSQMFSTSSLGPDVALAYEQSHSIVHYLAERYGFWRFRRLLKVLASQAPWEQALADEFHTKVGRLEMNWKQWLSDRLGSPS